MSVAEQMSLAAAKNHLSEVVDSLQRELGRVLITRHGHPAAVLLNADDLQSLEETLEILSDDRLTSDIREALSEPASETVALTKEEALRLATER